MKITCICSLAAIFFHFPLTMSPVDKKITCSASSKGPFLSSGSRTWTHLLRHCKEPALKTIPITQRGEERHFVFEKYPLCMFAFMYVCISSLKNTCDVCLPVGDLSSTHPSRPSATLVLDWRLRSRGSRPCRRSTLARAWFLSGATFKVHWVFGKGLSLGYAYSGFLASCVRDMGSKG